MVFNYQIVENCRNLVEIYSDTGKTNIALTFEKTIPEQSTCLICRTYQG